MRDENASKAACCPVVSKRSIITLKIHTNKRARIDISPRIPQNHILIAGEVLNKLSALQSQIHISYSVDTDSCYPIGALSAE